MHNKEISQYKNRSGDKMSIENTMRIEIERLREELNEAAAQDLSSEECFRLSLKLDALLERYYNAGGALPL